MDFLEYMQALGYELKEKRENVFSLIKKDSSADIILVFYKTDKIIRGFVGVNRLIETIDDMAHVYAQYRQMKHDLKEFAEFTHFQMM